MAEVAARCGYADQSHLSREIVRLAGDPLRALVRAGSGLIMISSRRPGPSRFDHGTCCVYVAVFGIIADRYGRWDKPESAARLHPTPHNPTPLCLAPCDA